MKSIKGLHHISCIMNNLKETYDFYTSVLGFQLIKKTVKVNDVSNYHMYFSCNENNRNDVISFFTSNSNFHKVEGTNCIEAFSILVENQEQLKHWYEKLSQKVDSISELFDYFDYKAFTIVDVNNITIYFLSSFSPTNQTYPLKLGPVMLKTSNIQSSELWLTTHLKMKQVARSNNSYLYSIGDTQLILTQDKSAPAESGIGSIDHIAFEVEDMDTLQEYSDALTLLGDTHSTILDRMYYHSLYVRDGNYILFEFVNHQPGYTVDEPSDKLGQMLSLPPYLECFKQEIIKQLPPLNTK